MDKKFHKKHYEDAPDEHIASKLKKQKLNQLDLDDLGIDEEEDIELFLEVKRLLK